MNRSPNLRGQIHFKTAKIARRPSEPRFDHFCTSRCQILPVVLIGQLRCRLTFAPVFCVVAAVPGPVIRIASSLVEKAVALNILMLPAELYETILSLIPRVSFAVIFGFLQVQPLLPRRVGSGRAVGGGDSADVLQPALRRLVFMDEHAAAVLGRLGGEFTAKRRGRFPRTVQ